MPYVMVLCGFPSSPNAPHDQRSDERRHHSNEAACPCVRNSEAQEQQRNEKDHHSIQEDEFMNMSREKRLEGKR